MGFRSKDKEKIIGFYINGDKFSNFLGIDELSSYIFFNKE
jgi:hypothetical protein